MLQHLDNHYSAVIRVISPYHKYHNDNDSFWSPQYNITRCKFKSDPAVIRPLRLRAGIHHVSQQEQDVDSWYSQHIKTDNNWIGIVQFRAFHIRFDADIVNIFLSFVEQQHLHKKPLKGGTHLNNWNVSRALTSGLGGITDCSQWDDNW